MSIVAALELLLPSVLHFLGLAGSALLAIGAISAWIQLPRPRTGSAAIALTCLAMACAATWLALALWTEGLQLGDTKAARFNALCRSAGLRIDQRLSGTNGVLVLSKLEKYVHYGYMGPPSPAALLARANVQFVEQQFVVQGDTRYARFSGPTAMVQAQQSLADVTVSMTTITSAGDMMAGIYGEEMLITERTTQRTLATLRYFWTTPRPVQSCPTPRQGIDTSQIVSYVVGLSDPALEERWREAFIP